MFYRTHTNHKDVAINSAAFLQRTTTGVVLPPNYLKSFIFLPFSYIPHSVLGGGSKQTSLKLYRLRWGVQIINKGLEC